MSSPMGSLSTEDVAFVVYIRSCVRLEFVNVYCLSNLIKYIRVNPQSQDGNVPGNILLVEIWRNRIPEWLN